MHEQAPTRFCSKSWPSFTSSKDGLVQWKQQECSNNIQDADTYTIEMISFFRDILIKTGLAANTTTTTKPHTTIKILLIMTMMAISTSSLYPTNWPKVPFHTGEVQIQKKLGTYDHVMGFAPSFIRPFMPAQHIEFYQNQPFLVVAARDDRGHMWSTLLFASAAAAASKSGLFVNSPDAKHLELQSQPLPGDALEQAFHRGSDMGILGIEFATRRRNRVNGRVASNDGNTIKFAVDQSFGNCPQYIKPRDWWMATDDNTASITNSTQSSTTAARANRLSPQQRQHIQNAETIFLATGYRGEGEDPRFGNDSSHRGGSAGFLIPSKDGSKVFLPDYAGNDMYNSLGNLMKDPRIGVTVPLYETGGMIQMTGTAKVHWEDEVDDNTNKEVSLSDFQGALRWLEMDIEEIVELPAGSLPIRWDSGDQDTQLQVVEKAKESEHVTSFYLAPVGGDKHTWSYLPGQHLTFTLPVDASNGNTVSRSYSISNFQPALEHKEEPFYRISVRRDPFGVGSTYLHDHVQSGDLVSVQKPSGSFTYDAERNSNKSGADRTVLFLSAGVGVTPVLSMLQSFARTDPLKRQHKNAIWVQTVRNAKQHSFKNEVEAIQQRVNRESGNECKEAALQTYISYTRPDPQDDPVSFDLAGRIDATILEHIISTVGGVDDASKLDVFMCGPNGFVASMEDALINLGVENIEYETF